MKTPQKPRVEDPNRVPEIYVAGPTNLTGFGNAAMLTFTHIRHDSAELFAGKGGAHATAIVRARIMMPMESIIALRDMLNGALGEANPAKIGTSTSSGFH